MTRIREDCVAAEAEVARDEPASLSCENGALSAGCCRTALGCTHGDSSPKRLEASSQYLRADSILYKLNVDLQNCPQSFDT